MDEVLQLIGTKRVSGVELLRFVQVFPGNVPLGYITQHWAIVRFGFSPFSARLPSELASVSCCVCLFFLLRHLGVRNVWAAIVAWMLLPLQLRYAFEARPYGQALFFSMLATLCFFRLLAKASTLNGLLYRASVALALYTAPYTLFIQFGYLAWIAFVRRFRVSAFRAAAALGVAACAFLPWYLDSVPHWRNMIATTAEVKFKITPKFLLLPLHEISGGGYVCSIALATLCALGFAFPGRLRSIRYCLLLGIVFGFSMVIVIDMYFGYFFAIRQIMFILVPLIVLAAQGISALLETERVWVAVLLFCTLMVSSLATDIRYLSDHSEDWPAGARMLRSALATGGCVMPMGPSDLEVYEIFDPGISSKGCLAGASSPIVVTAVTRYSNPDQTRELRERLLRDGFEPDIATRQAGGTTVAIYRRR